MDRWKTVVWDDDPVGTVDLEIDCKMCACHHKIHWSVVSLLVNLLALVLFTTAVATPHWASLSYSTYDVNTGLFQSCTELNDTCYDTHVYFHQHFRKLKSIRNTFAISVVFNIVADMFRMMFQHKAHLASRSLPWGVVSLLVNLLALVMFTTAVATPHWASQSYSTYDVNTGLFQSCTELEDTCYDTHVYFHQHFQKNTIVASAVLNVFALIGMWLFFALSIFFLCGLFEEKQLATGAIVTSYVSGLLALIGTIAYAATIKSLNYSLSWSFILAVLGFCVNIAAGVLMCVGRNISSRKKKKKKPKRDLGPVEEVQMEEAETTHKKIWATGGDSETTLKKAPLPGASNR